MILKEATYDALLKRYVMNPDTGKAIKVSSALTYDDTHPAKKKALEILSRAEDKGNDSSTEKSKVAAAAAAAPKTKPEKKKVEKRKPTSAAVPKQQDKLAVIKGVSQKVEPKSNKSEKSHKPKSNSYGISKECLALLKEKGFKALNAYPQSFVKPEEIVFNPELKTKSQDTIWVCKFPIIKPNGEKSVKAAYTAEFMKRSQVKKYKKISKIKSSDITSLDEKTSKLLKSGNRLIADSACILRIILKTGLRVGSLDEGASDTGNLGVRTMKVENVKINGNVLNINFIGKSYQENIADVDDPEVVDYVSKIIKGKKPGDRLFEVPYGDVGKVMKKINPKGINPKDLRTYKATEFAKKLLADTKITGAPPPLPDNPKEITKAVKEKLKRVFELTAQLLNNSAAMARNSYVHPVVITSFLNDLNLVPKQVGYKHVTLESKEMKNKKEDEIKFSSLDEMFDKFTYGNKLNENDSVEGELTEEDYDCEEYRIPDWFFRDDILLFKKKK